MIRVIPDWSVRKRHGKWRVYYDGNVWWSTHNTLPEAHTEATQNAVAQILYTPGGLTLLKELLDSHQ